MSTVCYGHGRQQERVQKSEWLRPQWSLEWGHFRASCDLEGHLWEVSVQTKVSLVLHHECGVQSQSLSTLADVQDLCDWNRTNRILLGNLEDMV